MLRRPGAARRGRTPAGARPRGCGLCAGAAGRRPASPLPERVGPYEILGKLGEGGCGIVSLARQAVPIKRQVALKVLRATSDAAELKLAADLLRRAIDSGYWRGQTIKTSPYLAKLRALPGFAKLLDRKLPG